MGTEWEKGRRNFRGESRKWCRRKGGKTTGKKGRENRRKRWAERGEKEGGASGERKWSGRKVGKATGKEGREGREW